jgi:hypothetical protein
MTENRKKHPYCFAKLEVVFPENEDGLRCVPESCLPCYYKTDCLREAMKGKEGLKVKEEMVDRAYNSGMIGFFKRWSDKKEFHRKMHEKK